MRLRTAALLLTAFTSAIVSAEQAAPSMKSFAYDCEAWELGVPPKDVFVVDGTIKVVERDGGRAIMVDPMPIVDATAQIGDSAAGAASIEAKIFASKKGRSFPRFGVSVHGMSGHRLIVNCAKKQIELIKADEVLASAPFTWQTDTWTHLKLSVTRGADGQWLIAGKAWPQDSTEPAEAMLQHQEPAEKIKGNGKAAFWGTPFSEMPLFIDDMKVEIEVKPE
jgi:hypothetical protein